MEMPEMCSAHQRPTLMTSQWNFQKQGMHPYFVPGSSLGADTLKRAY